MQTKLDIEGKRKDESQRSEGLLWEVTMLQGSGGDGLGAGGGTKANSREGCSLQCLKCPDLLFGEVRVPPEFG